MVAPVKRSSALSTSATVVACALAIARAARPLMRCLTRVARPDRPANSGASCGDNTIKRWSTAAVPRPKRLDNFVASLGEAVYPLGVDRVDPQTFHAEASFARLGSIGVGKTVGSPQSNGIYPLDLLRGPCLRTRRGDAACGSLSGHATFAQRRVSGWQRSGFVDGRRTHLLPRVAPWR